MVGGGAQGVAWRRTLARLSGRAIAVPDATELVALGAAAQAAALLDDRDPAAVARRWDLRRGGGASRRARPIRARVEQIEAALAAAAPLLAPCVSRLPAMPQHPLRDDPARAGARAHFRAMGIDPERLDGPIVGIASTWTGTMPCNLTQRELADQVAEAVTAAGGVPLIFNTIAVSDNQTQATSGMRASLVSREVIADSIELMASRTSSTRWCA